MKKGEKGGTTKGMKMCFWNVAGLIIKDKEVWDYLKSFDVIGLTETWIEEDNCEKLKFFFFFFYLFIKIHNLSNLDIWWNFLTVKLACWWLPPAGYHPRVS